VSGKRDAPGRWGLAGAGLGFALLASIVSAACRVTGPGPIASGPDPLGPIEAQYERLRFLKDQIDVTRFRNADRSIRGVPLSDLVGEYRRTRERVRLAVDAAPPPLRPEDRRALAIMRGALETDLPSNPRPTEGPAGADTLNCSYDATALGRLPGGPDSLTRRMYACFGRAAQDIGFEGQHLNRLTLLGRLPETDGSPRRRRLFLALEPVWRSVNGTDAPDSPWRVLLRLHAEQWKTSGPPSRQRMQQLGIDPATAESWLVRGLSRWRELQADSLLEPWDFYYAMGAASRRLDPRISRPDLTRLSAEYYRALGADPARLNIHYDLEPRPGKDPVSFTTFGARPARVGPAWTAGEPWVFTSYEDGSFDKLAELLHETGHGIHLAAIRTRPAFEDWPESDTFTEAIADLAALEIDEPAWQWRFLDDSAPLRASLQARYGGIVMDLAWALFEIRMQRDPALDPNEVWADVTREYLRIRPHPELSWWAMRGQLIDSPGYLLNYAVGAFIVADLRATIRARHGSFTTGDSTWYSWVSERLYRFGLERSAPEVLTGFLGREVSPDALLADMGRLGN
jgi:hypothetical protein